MKYVTYKLSNDFHNRQHTLQIPARIDCQLSYDQIRRSKARLCGSKDCTCSDLLGRRGKQPNNGEWFLRDDLDQFYLDNFGVE